MLNLPVNRRQILASAALGAPLVPFVPFSSAARAAQSGETIVFTDLLSRAERADILAGTNSIDITPRLTAAIAGLPPGATLDARALRNIVTLTADPFAKAAVPDITFSTGAVTFKKDFNAGPILLPSRFTWRGEGSRLIPSRPIERIPVDYSPGVGMVATALANGRCTGTRNALTIELDHPLYAAGISPGCRLAIFGLEPDPQIVPRTATAIQSGTETIAFAESVMETLGNSLVHLLIDQEVMIARIVDGVARISGGGARGALGTAATRHARGAPVRVLRSALFTVQSISGRTVRLDRALPRSFVSAQFRAGSIASRLTGQLEIDGQFNRARASGMYSCLVSTLGTGLTVDGQVSLRRGMHGGFLGYGCDSARVSLEEISGCGSPAKDTGASIILFARVSRSEIKVGRVTDSTIGYAIDNKSFGLTYYGLDGPCTANTIQIDRLDRHKYEGQISGSSGNRVLIADAETSVGSVIIDSGIRQSGTRVPTLDNEVTTLRQNPPWPPLGDALAENRARMPRALR